MTSRIFHLYDIRCYTTLCEYRVAGLYKISQNIRDVICGRTGGATNLKNGQRSRFKSERIDEVHPLVQRKLVQHLELFLPSQRLFFRQLPKKSRDVIYQHPLTT